MKKLISVSLPCRNEELNIPELVKKIEEQFDTYLPEYDYQIQFSDNCSTDGTRRVLREICRKDPKVRAIFNVQSFAGSPYHSILQTDGDCCIHMAADFQDPPECIPQLVHEWEKGAKCVCAIKTSSKENGLMWRVRTLYYKIMRYSSSVNLIDHFTGFGLYDRDFIEIMRRLNDPIPSIRGVVAEYGYQMSKITFVQPKRKHGKSNNNFYRLFDFAMKNFTSYTKIGMHVATLVGMGVGALSFLLGIVFLILKLVKWDQFSAGIAPLIISMFFLGAVQLFFIGIVGEYVATINSRTVEKPLVVEEERINFPEDSQPKPDYTDLSSCKYCSGKCGSCKMKQENEKTE